MKHRRTFLVTGATGGIGRAVAVELARRGDRVLLVGRDAARGAAVLSHLGEDGGEDCGEGGGHAFVQADLSLLRESARVSDLVGRYTDRLDGVVFCAGVLATVTQWTDEGLERTFVLNYLSRYLLARLLLPRLAPSGRIVLVANAGKYGDTLDLQALRERRDERGLHVSGRTQFANDLLAVELAERTRDSGIKVACVFPGLVATDVFRNAVGLSVPLRAVAIAVQRLVGMTPEAAAATPVQLAADPGAIAVSGSFFGPRRRPIRVPERALSPDRRAAVWAAGEDLVRPWLTDKTEEKKRK